MGYFNILPLVLILRTIYTVQGIQAQSSGCPWKIWRIFGAVSNRSLHCHPTFWILTCFEFFDLGVQSAIARTLTVPILPQTYSYGNAFEQFLIMVIIRLNSYLKKDFEFSYLRTKDDAEIDLIIDRPGLPLALVEIKSSRNIQSSDVGTLKAFTKDMSGSQPFCLSQDPTPKIIEGVSCLPWKQGLVELGF